MQGMEKLMGLAIFGERVAARTYALMGELRPEFAPLMRKFASMEGQHATAFMNVSRKNGVEPDKDFASRELGYLTDQVDVYHREGSFESLAVLQGFIVESLAIATYEPFLAISDKYAGATEVFKQALEDEHYHVNWIIRYLRLRFYDADDEFMGLAGRVNVQGIDCIGGTMMNITDCLNEIGLSGAECAASLMSGYTELLEQVGVEPARASSNVMSLFLPLARKYRRGERTK